MIQDFLLDIWALTAEMAPYLLLGFLLAGLMHEFIPRQVYSDYLSKNNFRSVWLAALFGVPLPLCSCGVLPTAMGLRREGGSRGATVSFLIATPQTGVDSIFATYSLMGLPFAVLRPIAAFATAILGGTLVNQGQGARDNKEQGAKDNKEQGAKDNKEQGARCKEQEECIRLDDKQPANVSSCSLRLAPCSLMNALRYGFVEMMGDIGKWLVVGLVVAGMITTLVPDQWFEVFKDNSLLSILLVLCISVPMYVCATGSIPIAVALMMKGLTPGAALVLLMAGPACNVASMLVINKVLGRRTLVLYLLSIVGGAVLFGLGIDYLLPRQWFTANLLMQSGSCHEGHVGWFGIAATIVLMLLLVNALFHHDDHDEEDMLASNTPTTTIHIEGMNCSHCAANVEKAIRSVEGVGEVVVSLGDKSATMSGQADIEEIKRAIESLGFKVVDK